MLNARTLAAFVLPLALWTSTACADPITLKAAFWSSDRSVLYQATMGPLIDAVNGQPGNLKIVLYAGGVLGRDLAQQPQVVREGTADIAFVVPGYTPDLFPDNSIVELPGLFRNAREASLVYTRLIAKNALSGLEDFVVLGAYVTQPETIHSRVPILSVDDLKGKRIRVNNPMQAAVLGLLGTSPVRMEVNKVASALSTGAIDATTIPMTPLADYGVKRLATYHFLLTTSGAPLLVLMNRKKFESLPEAERALLRKYSGEWAAEQFFKLYDGSENEVLRQLQSEAGRHVIEPSAADLARARAAFETVTAEWIAKSGRNAALLEDLKTERAAIRKQ